LNRKILIEINTKLSWRSRSN